MKEFLDKIFNRGRRVDKAANTASWGRAMEGNTDPYSSMVSTYMSGDLAELKGEALKQHLGARYKDPAELEIAVGRVEAARDARAARDTQAGSGAPLA